jgi:NADH-quinone oxidoreductase subunit M
MFKILFNNNNNITLKNKQTILSSIINYKNVMISSFIIFSIFINFINYEMIKLLNNPLYLIILILILTLIILYSIPHKLKNIIRFISLTSTSFIYLISLTLWIFFDRTTPKFQYMFNLGKLYFLNTDIIFAIDGISLFFVLLTNIFIYLCILSLNKNTLKIKEVLLHLLFLQ